MDENTKQNDSNLNVQTISPRDAYIVSLSKHDRTQNIIDHNLIILNAHFIEKEMVVNGSDNASMKFLKPISVSLLNLLENDPQTDRFAILLATKLLITYDPEDTLMVQQKIPFQFKIECQGIEVGRKKAPKLSYNKKGIKFLYGRHSYRNYKNIIIDQATIDSIIDLASNTPTACNRQPCRILYSTTKEGNDLIRKLVPDQFVASHIFNFFVITVDRSFFNPGEELQELINGGIFLESLLLSIHAHGLGATAFQTSVFVSQNRENLKPYGFNDNELIVATVGYGIPIEKTSIAAAYKRNATDISRRI